KQAMQFIRREVDHRLAVLAAQQAHRNYAKRQMAWFRREPGVHWLHGFGDDPAIQAQAIAVVAQLSADPLLASAKPPTKSF
ncbi:MAG TPA: hypothetical protein VK657_03430, partial [Terriglobales bacterium]|nr:hypothetical protein [Terriglobales bacterium]